MILKFLGYTIIITSNKYKSPTGAIRAKRLYSRRRRDGLCKRCRIVITEINPWTKKLYSTCYNCRQKENKKKQLIKYI